MSATTAIPPGTGHIGTLTPVQESTLARFRTQVRAAPWYDSARHDDDALLLRFLRARKFDQAPTNAEGDAFAMLDAAEVWRKKEGVDQIAQSVLPS